MRIAALALTRVPSEAANSIQVMKACHAMAALGHAVTLLVPDSPGLADTPWEALASLYGLSTRFTIEWLPLRSRRLFTWQLVRRARALQAELIYAWPLQSAVFALASGCPAVFEAHEPPSGQFGPWWYRFFVRIQGRKRVAVITRALQDILQDRFGQLPADGYVIAPNGIELERFEGLPEAAAARAQIGLAARPTVLCAGHLYAGRGAGLFVQLARRMPGVSFVWAGGRADDVSTWRRQAEGLTNITFTGFIPNQNLPLHLAAADVLMMPYERAISGSSGGDSAAVASPMKMFEYMAAGRAILSSDLAVIHEVLDERCAVFCPPEDAAAWQAALEQLLADPDRRAALAAEARQRALAYTWRQRQERILAPFGPP